MKRQIKATDITSLAFWTREYKFPLFWFFVDRPGVSTQDQMIAKDEGDTVALYFINGAEIKLAKRGRLFFSDPRNLNYHRQEVKRAAEEIAILKRKYSRTDFTRFSLVELREVFDEILGTLVFFVMVYTRTEPPCLSLLATLDSPRSRQLIKALGRLRLSLRTAGGEAFYTFMEKILRAIAARAGVPYQQIFFYTYQELKHLLQGRNNKPTNISLRQCGWAVVSLSRREKDLFVGRRLKALKDRMAKLSPGNTRFLRGQVASPGMVKGIAQVIQHDERDISKAVARFKPGRILVTEMTRPDVITACRRAVAIVTDEGGITSHAAIISRELAIPCVIGTGEASRLIKTGDKILVDAQKGIVKKL